MLGISAEQLRRLAEYRNYKTEFSFVSDCGVRSVYWSRRDLANIRMTKMYQQAVHQNKLHTALQTAPQGNQQ